MPAGGFWDENEAGWPTPPRLLPSSAQKQLKNGLFGLNRVFYIGIDFQSLSNPQNELQNRSAIPPGSKVDDYATSESRPKNSKKSKYRQNRAKEGVFSLFYIVFSTKSMSTSANLYAAIPLGMLTYMKNVVKTHPFDGPTLSCAPHSGPAVIPHFGRNFAVTELRRLTCNFRD